MSQKFPPEVVRHAEETLEQLRSASQALKGLAFLSKPHDDSGSMELILNFEIEKLGQIIEDIEKNYGQ